MLSSQVRFGAPRLFVTLLSFVPYAVQAEECAGVFATPPESTQCTYEHLPFRTFYHTNGTVSATWPTEYQVLEVHIASD